MNRIVIIIFSTTFLLGQLITKDQIEKFGQHMFKEGSIVIPGTTNYDDQYYAVKLESTFFGVPVESYFDKLVGLEIKGKSSGVTAVVKSVLKASKSTQNATTIYVKYRAASENDQTTLTFQDGENALSTSHVIMKHCAATQRFH